MRRSAGATLIVFVWLSLLLPVGAAEASPGLSVTPLDGETLTAEDLVDALVGEGVTTSDATYSHPDAFHASGTFSGGTGIIGFEGGVLLTSGDVANVVGPNAADNTGTVNGVPGDPDLDGLSGGTTQDASVLEFDFVPAEQTVTFRYVFGSDEYNEFVYQGFNDVFGFFVNEQNCATVPNTGQPVSIDTINGGNPFGDANASHPELYLNNDLSDGGGTIDTELDGLTVVLTCTADVTPNVTNHVKLAIADVGDGAFDSAVFLEAGSFVSETHTLTVTTSGDGDGVVTSDDEGIDCDSSVGDPELTDCDETYDAGTQVSLTATPDEGSVFGQWTGCDVVDGNLCTVTMNDERTVDAQFDVEEDAADLGVTKSDSAPGSGPDPVSSGGVVAYQVSVSNSGPDDATGVTVVDSATNGTVQSASGTDWTCGTPSENSITCAYGPTLAAGQTAAPITVLVQAPTNAGTTNVTMTDEATVTGDQADPNPANDSDIETTTVTGSGSAFAQDHAQTFFDGETTTTLQTTRDPNGRFYSTLVIPGNSGLGAGVVSIDEFNASLPQFDGFCGGRDCDAQVQITVLPPGQTSANNPIQVIWFYFKDKKQGTTVYVKGDNETVATVVRNCLVPGIADPPKCVNSKTILPNGDRQFIQLWRDGGDPGGGKR